MKRNLLISALIAGLVLTASYSNAQHRHYVNEVPHEVVVERGVAPSPAHVWIAPEWVWHGDRYVRVEGHWGMPPRPGRVWVPGSWQGHNAGYHWVPGRWR